MLGVGGLPKRRTVCPSAQESSRVPTVQRMEAEWTKRGLPMGVHSQFPSGSCLNDSRHTGNSMKALNSRSKDTNDAGSWGNLLEGAQLILWKLLMITSSW